MSLFARRTVMTVIGVLLCSFSIGMFMHSNFGLDPFQSLSQGVYTLFRNRTSYGNYYMLWSAAILLADLFLDRSQIGVATFAHLFLTGYVVDASKLLLETLLPAPSFAVRMLLLVLGVVITCIGAALYFTSAQGVSVYDAVANGLVHRKFSLRGKPVPFRYIRIFTDVCCVLGGMAFGMMPGIGTVIIAFFMGPLIEFFERTIAEPMLRNYRKKPA